MPTVSTLRSRQTAWSHLFLLDDRRLEPRAEGPAGLALDQAIDTAYAHLHEPTLLRSPWGQTQSADEIDYPLSPPKRTFTMLVTVRMTGRGKPLPYPLDDEADEA
jgi:hypothetical protein